MRDMTVKPEYSKYRKRLLEGFGRIIILSIIWTGFLLLGDIDKVGAIVISSILSILVLILTISVVNKSKIYLTEIKVEGDSFVLESNKYDKPNATIISTISETRIKIWEMFFPFTRVGRNYKLVIETKQGRTYKPIVQQYEIGNWDLAKFKEVVKIYGEVKGVPISTASFNRTIFRDEN